MLEMRPDCERCGRDLPPDSSDARIQRRMSSGFSPASILRRTSARMSPAISASLSAMDWPWQTRQRSVSINAFALASCLGSASWRSAYSAGGSADCPGKGDGRKSRRDSAQAFSSFECTFCAECVEGAINGICPNCGGSFQVRPTRADHLLGKYPASTQRKGPQ